MYKRERENVCVEMEKDSVEERENVCAERERECKKQCIKDIE